VAPSGRADRIIHLIRNTFRLASTRGWDALRHDVKPIYTAVNPAAARAALEELTETWGTKYAAIIRLVAGIQALDRVRGVDDGADLQS